MGNKQDRHKKDDQRLIIPNERLIIPDDCNRDDFIRAIRESKESYAFVVEKYRSNWIYRPPYRRDYIMGYKLVALMWHGGNPELLMNVIGLLQLRIPGKIYSSTPGKQKLITHADAIHRSDKLCTDQAMPVGIQIMGPPQHVERFAQDLSNGYVEMVSQFNPMFVYKLGAEILEPRLGQMGQGCIQGIHFFINKSECIKYLKLGFSGINLFGCTISKAIEDQRDQIVLPQHESRFIQMPDGVYYCKQTIHQPKSSDICCICLEGIWEKDVCVSRCQHYFHKFCITRQNLLNNCCPLCRGNLV